MSVDCENMAKHKYGIVFQDIKNDIYTNIYKCFYEIIANGLDADATRIIIDFTTKQIETLINNDLVFDKIEIYDNGEGIIGQQELDIANKFAPKGFSDKNTETKQITTKGRKLLGKLGKGRHQVFGIGGLTKWETFNCNNHKWNISFNINDKENLDINNASILESKGTKLTIENLTDNAKKLDIDEFIDEMQYFFALYIEKYDIELEIKKDGKQYTVINKKTIKSRIVEQEETINGEQIQFIFWKDFKTGKIKEIFLCNNEGITIKSKQESNLPPKTSIHIKFKNIETINGFDFDDKEIHDLITQIKNKAWIFYKSILTSENNNRLQKWKEEGILPKIEYPVESEVKNIEQGMLESFSILLSDILNLKTGQDKTKCRTSFIISCINKALENDIETFLSIILNIANNEECFDEVRKLGESFNFLKLFKIGMFYQKRLLTIQGLKKLVDSFSLEKTQDRELKERTQLQKIIEESCWIFGEEYALNYGDKSISTIVSGIQNKKCEISDKKPDILCATKNANNEYLLIELKAPSVKINKEAIDQIDNYKSMLSKHLIGAKITAFVISTELDDYAKEKATNNPRDGYLYIYTWSDIFTKFENTLATEINKISSEMSMDDGYKYLKAIYSKVLGDSPHQN